MSSFSSSPSFMSDPAFSSSIAHNPLQWPPTQANLTHRPSDSSSSGHSSASSSSHSSSSTSSGSDMPSHSVLPDISARRKKKPLSSAPQQAPQPSSNPILSHPPLSRSRSSLFVPKGHQLDRIDELDESSPLGPLHHGGPYEAATRKGSSPIPHPPVMDADNDIDEHNSRYLSSELDDDEPEDYRPSRRHASKPKKPSKTRQSKAPPPPQFTPGSHIGKSLNLVPGQIIPRGLLESLQYDPSQPISSIAPGQVMNWQSQISPQIPNAAIPVALPSPVDHWSSSQSTSSSSSGSFSSGRIRPSHPSVNRLRRHGSSESFTSEPSSPTSSSYSHSSKESHKSSVPPRHRGRHAHGAPSRNLAPRHVAENMRQQQFALQASMLNSVAASSPMDDILIPTPTRTDRREPVASPRPPEGPASSYANLNPPSRGVQDSRHIGGHPQPELPPGLTDRLMEMTISSSDGRRSASPYLPPGTLSQLPPQDPHWAGANGSHHIAGVPGHPVSRRIVSGVDDYSMQEARLTPRQDGRRSRHSPSPTAPPHESGIFVDERPRSAALSTPLGHPDLQRSVNPRPHSHVGYDARVHDQLASDQHSARSTPDILSTHSRRGSDMSWSSAPPSINLSMTSSTPTSSSVSDGPRPHYLPKKLVMPEPLQRAQMAPVAHPNTLPHSSSGAQLATGVPSPLGTYDPYAEIQSANPVIPDLYGRRVLKKRSSVPAAPTSGGIWQGTVSNPKMVYPSDSSRSSPSYSANLEKEVQKAKKLSKRRSEF